MSSRALWVGPPTVKATLADRIAPGWLDRNLAKSGYRGQLTGEPLPYDAAENLFESVKGPYCAHGRFDDLAKPRGFEMLTDRHRAACWIAAGTLFVGGVYLIARRGKNS